MRPSASQVVTDVAMQHTNFIAAEDSDDEVTDVEEDLHLANVDVDKVSLIARNSDWLTTYNWHLPLAWTMACSPRASKPT